MTAPTSIPAPLTRNLALIESALRHAVGTAPDDLDAVTRYALGWEDADGKPVSPSAKRIRPSLCLLAAECCEADAAVAISGAVAIELLHNFSLVHDDIQDRDHERHGRPTLWSRLGEAQAINAGDFLFTLSMKALSAESTIAADLRIRALDVLADAAAKMIRGQWTDLQFETRSAVSATEYFAMVEGKTGALLGASLEIGAILAGAPATTSHALGRWGVALGLAFQAHDDILGIWGQPEITGKSATGDIARKKRTLPIVLALTDERSRATIEREFSAETPDVASVLDALDACEARERAEAIARTHADSADTLLEEVPLAPARQEELVEVSRYVVSRQR